MIPPEGWDTVHLMWRRQDGILDVFVGRRVPESLREEGQHGSYRSIWTTADVCLAIETVLTAEQLNLLDGGG
jgi:hypothetical protein